MALIDGYPQPQSVEESYQSMEGLIKELDTRSRFSSSTDANGITRLEKGKESFSIETVGNKGEKGNKRIARKIYTFLMDVFDEEEVDDKESIELQIQQAICSYSIVKNAKGEIVSVMSAQMADMVQSKGSHDQALIVWYVVTSDDQKGKGLALELYRNVYRHALDTARLQNKRISSIVGEAVKEVEGYLGKMGRKRPYFTDKDGNLCEIPFPQAPIGAETVDKEPPQEHLMVRFLDDRSHCSISEILALVKTVFAQYLDPRYDDLYDSESEIEQVKKATQKLYRGIKTRVSDSKNDDVILLNAKEREEMREMLEQKGKRIIEIE